MPIIVFHRKTWKIYDESPPVDTVPKHSILCAAGDTRQKWYLWSSKGWIQTDGYMFAIKHRNMLKTLYLLLNKQVPEDTGTEPKIKPFFY